MRQILAITFLGLSALSTTADAGVRGGHFVGSLKYSDGDDAGYLSTDFAQTGNGFVETFNYGEGLVTYQGTYTETDLGFISVWSAHYTDFTNYQISGICLFGFVSTYRVDDTVGYDDFSGYVHKSGSAPNKLPKPSR